MRIFTKMKKNLYKTIELGSGLNAKFIDNIFTISGPAGTVSKKMNFGKLNVDIQKDKIIIGNEKSTKTEKKMMNTNSAHIRNMIKGATKMFEYELKICSGHFPMTVKKEGNKAIIKNFLGEKVDRTCSIPKGVEVEINKTAIIVKSVDKELAGQVAANFEKATTIRGRDKRIFQDGIYIIKKAGRII